MKIKIEISWRERDALSTDSVKLLTPFRTNRIGEYEGMDAKTAAKIERSVREDVESGSVAARIAMDTAEE